MVSLFAQGGDLTTTIPKERAPEIGFNLYEGYLVVVEGRIGDLDHKKLLLDTGSSPSMIDKGIAEKLGLKGVPRGLALLNKNLDAQSVMLPSVDFGPISRRNLSVMVADLSKIGKSLGTHIDAVIGLDVIGATSFTIDFQKRRMFFHASEERHSASFTAGPQFIAVKVKTGNRQLRLLLDTGTSHLVLFRNALHNLDYDWTAVSAAERSISGVASYGTVVVEKALFGTDDVGPTRASVVAGEQNVDRDFDGLIGIALLRPKRLSFDFDRQLLAWSN